MAPVPFAQLRDMAAMLRHRGPDGYGLYRDDRVGLAHTRLSIIDLAGGAQPIHNEDRSVWITFNGEIFNYVELRRDLERCGHRFYTRGDTEVIVHSFEEYGQQAWAKFNGQFAFALWDNRSRRLWLVRDRVGILPLYYARVADRVLFASEAKALFASGQLEPAFDGAGLVKVFSRWAAPSPATVFQRVQSVSPGRAVSFDEKLTERVSTYWRPNFAENGGLAAMPLHEAVEGLGERLDHAVNVRLRADVPVGAYLSGGLDSSVIASLIRDTDGSRLQTFAVRFDDPEFDETVEQRRMAELLGTEHHEIRCRDADIGEVLREVIWHCETPLLRTAPAPLFMLSQIVRSHGMKVVLTGEGADELLAGYHIFKEDKVRRFWARQPDSTARPALLARLYPYIGQGATQSTGLWQQFFRRGLAEVHHPFYSHMVRWQNTAWALRFLAPDIRAAITDGQIEADLESMLPPGWRQWRPLSRAQLIEMTTFMSSYLLSCQGDRVAMGHSVEVRYPFLDPEVVDFCAGLPARMKLCGLRDKVALRNLAASRLPRDIWQRPKQPYRAPMTRALFGAASPDYVEELLSPSYLARFGLVDCGPATKLVDKARRRGGRMSGEREEMALVGLLTLQLMAHLYLESFNTRAAALGRGLDHWKPCVAADLVAA